MKVNLYLCYYEVKYYRLASCFLCCTSTMWRYLVLPARKLSLVGDLPGGNKSVKSYAGYLTVNKKYNSNLFFWFFPASMVGLTSSFFFSFLPQGRPKFTVLLFVQCDRKSLRGRRGFRIKSVWGFSEVNFIFSPSVKLWYLVSCSQEYPGFLLLIFKAKILTGTELVLLFNLHLCLFYYVF